ncbi:MAG: multidrug effflux MFS transporter [Gammaproteobacteria bacterium]|nr:multidrug effflux MFS transporter [Gammaproteobacteria bacterium]
MPARLPPFWLLIVVSALGPIVLNGVLPANTRIAQDFSVPYGSAQMVLTVYLVATMFAQIVLGNLADRYGRRPVMIGGMLVFALGSLLCSLSISLEMLLLGRLVQGAGSSVCMVLPRTVIRDVFTRDRAASMIGYMTTAMMLAPLFGPALGGWITDVSTWRYLYAGLAAVGLVVAVLCYWRMHETLPASDVRPLGSRFVVSARILLGSPLYRAYLAMLCGAVGVYYAFLGGAPYVVMELYGVSASAYGLWFAVIAIGYLLGNLVAGRFSDRVGGDRMMLLSLPPMVIGMILFWAFSSVQHPLAVFLPMQLITFSNGVLLPNLMSATMSVRPDLAGSASGLAGTCQTASGIVLTLALSLWLQKSAYPLLWVMTLSVLLALWGYYLKERSSAAPD